MNDETKIKDIIVNLKKCFYLILRYSRLYMCVTLCFSILQGIFPALSLVVMQKILNKLQSGDRVLLPFIYLIIVYTLIDMISSLLSAIYNYYYTKFLSHFNKHIELLRLKKGVELSLRDYENTETYDVINRAQQQNGQTVLSFFGQFMSILQLVITICSSLIILANFRTGWIVILIILIFPFLKYLFTLKIAKMQYDMRSRRTKDERNIWYIDYLIMTGVAFKEIRIFGLKEYFIKKYTALMDKIIQQDVNLAKKSILVQTGLLLCDQIAAGGAFLYLVFCGIKQIILIGDVVTYTRCIFSIKNNLESIFEYFSSIANEALLIGWLFDFLELKTAVPLVDSSVNISGIDTIQMIHVSYKYKGSSEYALRDISFTIKKNEVLGIVGKNGSGKSTLIKIILGLYDDYEGDILVNDINLKAINKESYYESVSCVFQDYMKYEASLKDNIGYGDLEHIDNTMEIENILKYVKLKENIWLEDGIDVLLGNWFGKKQLSIGEWQRVAIGRGIFKKSKLCIMDEPDASIDAEAERQLIQMYKKVFSHKIGIYVTHKINHVRYLTDQIVVLDNGNVSEFGTHTELMKHEGIYYKLFKLQEESR
ncbi:ABC transporter ATP-binding protein [Lactonifactor longoviformis]|uniref:ABC transporter ATP-binding protein n=1 Tax=Lactonifactor longoviformis TaxID=341220 RepID=UPI0036F1E1F5